MIAKTLVAEEKKAKKAYTKQLKAVSKTKRTMKSLEVEVRNKHGGKTHVKRVVPEKNKAKYGKYSKLLKAQNKKLAKVKKTYKAKSKLLSNRKKYDNMNKSLKSINSQIKKTNKVLGQPKSAIYLADLSSDQVIFFGEFDATETNAAETPSQPVDNSDPRTNYSRRTDKTISCTAYLYAQDNSSPEARQADLEAQFNMFQKWQLWGRELTLRGSSYWKHVYIQSISKSTENKDQNVLKLSLTFSYRKIAKVTYSKKKSKGKKTAKAGSASKRDPRRNRVHHMKVGDNIYRVAKKYGVPVSKLYAENPKAKTRKGKVIKI